MVDKNHYRVEIRNATLQDIHALLAIEQACFTTDCLSRRQFRYLLSRAKALCFVGAVDSWVVGYAIVFIPQNPKAARLYSIAVLPQWRHLGIANQLFQQLSRALKTRGYGALRLEVRSDSQVALQWYYQLGFKVIQSLPAYYEDGADGVRMIKALTSNNMISKKS